MSRTGWSMIVCALVMGCGGKDKPPAATPGGEVKTEAPADIKPVSVDFTSVGATNAHFAGYVVDYAGFTDNWQGLHAKLKTEAARLVKPTGNNPTPTGKLTLYVYDDHANTPDLATVKDEDVPMDHLLAIYDNELTGSWRFCFGGARGNANMAKCVRDTDPVSAALYDVNVAAPE